MQPKDKINLCKSQYFLTKTTLLSLNKVCILQQSIHITHADANTCIYMKIIVNIKYRC